MLRAGAIPIAIAPRGTVSTAHLMTVTTKAADAAYEKRARDGWATFLRYFLKGRQLAPPLRLNPA